MLGQSSEGWKQEDWVQTCYHRLLPSFTPSFLPDIYEGPSLHQAQGQALEKGPLFSLSAYPRGETGRREVSGRWRTWQRGGFPLREVRGELLGELTLLLKSEGTGQGKVFHARDQPGQSQLSLRPWSACPSLGLSFPIGSFRAEGVAQAVAILR